MAPSAGLVSLLADHTTPSFLLEAAVEYLESLDEKINECELVKTEGVNNDERRNNGEEEDEGKVHSNRHDDGDETNKRLEGGAEQQTWRKRREGSHSTKENEAELVRLRKQRDVIVRDIQWLQALHARTPSPSFPSSTQPPHSSSSTPTHNPLSSSSNSLLNPLSSPSVSSHAIVEHGSGGIGSIGGGSSSTTATITGARATAHHQNGHRTRAEGPWGRRSKVRGRERMRRPRSGGDGAATAAAAAMVEDRDAGCDGAGGGNVVAVGGEENEEKGPIGVAL